jgi:hypothetical protein
LKKGRAACRDAGGVASAIDPLKGTDRDPLSERRMKR